MLPYSITEKFGSFKFSMTRASSESHKYFTYFSVIWEYGFQQTPSKLACLEENRRWINWGYMKWGASPPQISNIGGMTVKKNLTQAHSRYSTPAWSGKVTMLSIGNRLLNGGFPGPTFSLPKTAIKSEHTNGIQYHNPTSSRTISVFFESSLKVPVSRASMD